MPLPQAHVDFISILLCTLMGGIFEPFNLLCFKCYVKMLYTVLSEINMGLCPLRRRFVDRTNCTFFINVLNNVTGGRSCTNQASPHLAQSTVLNRWSVKIFAVISIRILMSCVSASQSQKTHSQPIHKSITDFQMPTQDILICPQEFQTVDPEQHIVQYATSIHDIVDFGPAQN